MMASDYVSNCEFQWCFPYTAFIVGATGCGKTVYVARIIRNHNKQCSQPLKSVLYFYAIHQKIYQELEEEFGEQTSFIEGTPEQYFESHDPKELENCLVILDDLGQELGKSSLLESIYSRMSHHYRFSVVLILQEFF